MTKRKRRRLFFRFALIAALLVGSVRGWVRGVEAGQLGSRGDGFTVRIDSEEIGARVIREKLVDSLAKTTFKLTPFAGDPSPERVERVTLSQGDL